MFTKSDRKLSFAETEVCGTVFFFVVGALVCLGMLLGFDRFKFISPNFCRDLHTVGVPDSGKSLRVMVEPEFSHELGHSEFNTIQIMRP